MSFQAQEQQKTALKGAFVLTVAALITKVLSAFYRIPYQNISGDIGFYIYQQVYPLYGIVLALSTYGYPVAISKLIAENKQKQFEMHIVRLSFYFLTFVGFISFCFLYFGASFLATMMGDHQLTLLIRTVSFSFLLLPFTSTLRGYFQGKNNMLPTAVSQVAEQTVRVAAILTFSYVLLMSGSTVYEAGAGAMFGSLLGGFAALFVLIAYWLRQKHVSIRTNISFSSKETKRVLFFLAIQGMTICLANMVLIFIQFVDSLSLLSLLQAEGLGNEAKMLKGIYDRGQPLIQLGTVVATSFSLALVPALSSDQIRSNELLIREKIHLTLRIAFVVGLGASVGLVCLIKPTNIMLFKDASGMVELTILSCSILFTSLTLTLIAILQGLGYVLFPVLAVFVGIVMKWMLNMWLVPHWQTVGAAFATLLTYVGMTLLQYAFLYRKMKNPFISKSIIVHTVFSAFMMAVFLIGYLWITNQLFSFWQHERLFSAVQAVLGVFLGGIVYIIIIMKKGIFLENELTVIPFGYYFKKYIVRKADTK
ncbi:PST family polysaccharide transporter [Thermolongibacillus altinsuensis]|uniref:PST family polysaccharide transporter n=1 Tax=Thermolongibacillus altinsuensis TaxID=575256 RepID=A0A4R1QAN0_9BACL|nr:polysaccharide biosynthesis protein [Thermolongibacillus altinsuensis]TCL46095.1 PST family polysaccharide transporter [Thermolongibacillus altinsuensis]